MEAVFTALAEMAGPVALVAFLATLYGNIKSIADADGYRQLALGALFGGMSVVMMFSTKEPFEGLLIDLRNVPIALAGAFLGLRGMLACLAVAAMTRLGMGGVGANAGVASMVISGFAGLLWAEWRSQWARPCWQHYAMLCGMVATNQVGIVLLPADMAIWFLQTASPPLIVMNSATIFLVATLLDRETMLISTRDLIREARGAPLTRAFLTEDGMVSGLRTLRTTGAVLAPAGVLAVKLDYAPWIAKTWGEEAIAKVLLTLRGRLERTLELRDMIALSDKGYILVPVTEAEMGQGAALEAKVVAALTAERVKFGPEDWTRISVCTSLTALDASDPAAPLVVTAPRSHCNDCAPPPRIVRAASAPWTGKGSVSRPLETALFYKAERLMR